MRETYRVRALVLGVVTIFVVTPGAFCGEIRANQ